MVKLSDAFDLQMGKTPARANDAYWNDGSNQWVSIADLSRFGKYVDETKETISDLAVSESGIKIVPANTVIMSFKLSIGKTAITKDPVYTNEAIMAFIPNGKYEIDTNYLYHMLSSRDWSKGTNRAVMGATLNKATLGEIEIHIPPVAEQLEIAEILDKVDELIANRNGQLDHLDMLVKSRFIELFGDPESNPFNWQRQNLGKLLLIERGGSPRPIDHYITESEDGVNWIKIGDAQPGSIYITATKQRIRTDGCKKSRHVKPGDFILSNSMSFGRPYIMKIDGYIHDGWLLLRDEKNRFNKLFLHSMLSSNYTYNCFKSMAEGGVVNNLNKELVGKLVVYIPPMELQNEFAAFVEHTDKLKLAVTEALAELEILKKSLMQQYFG